MRVEDLGCIPYEEALALQERAVADVIGGGEERLYLLEHPPVITLGTDGGADNLHVSEEWLRERNVTVHATKRGGNITCHFPGQLVAYPILRLEKRPGGLRRYFNDLEEAVIRLLDRYGVAARREEGRTGVWVPHEAGSRKICSMGVAVRRWVSYHGLALNVDRDISLFDGITLCGLHGAAATSLHLELDRLHPPPPTHPTMDDVKHALTEEIWTLLAPS